MNGISVGVVGVGEFGVSLAARRLPRMRVTAFADIDVPRALERLGRIGMGPVEVVACETAMQALAALEAGKRVVVHDPLLLCELPLDVLVDASGHAETAAQVAERGIAHGKHIVMATKEVESAIGPLLYRKARAAGLVYTPVDGDQPSLLIKLMRWAGELGLGIVAAGKASEHDFVFDPREGTVTSQQRSMHVPGLRDVWSAEPDGVAGAVARRSELLQAFPRKSVPDFCEMCVVANATGLLPDQPAMHAPIARTAELPELFCRREEGGLFARDGTLDIFNCLRRPDEVSFAGSVFVVADIHDDTTFAVLRAKGIPASRHGSRLLLYNPTHLLGVEAPVSILAAVLSGQSSVGDDYRPRVDLVGRARRDLAAGTRLAIGDTHTHSIPDIEPLLVDAAPLGGAAPVPYYLAVGQRLARDVKAGEMLAADMLVAPAGSSLWRLRREQDSAFRPPR